MADKLSLMDGYDDFLRELKERISNAKIRAALSVLARSLPETRNAYLEALPRIQTGGRASGLGSQAEPEEREMTKKLYERKIYSWWQG